MSQIIHQHLSDALALDAWEPLDGYALVTCKIRIHEGALDKWESRSYEFQRTSGGWTIGTNPGYLRRESWQQIVDWFRRMQPIEINLLTSV